MRLYLAGVPPGQWGPETLMRLYMAGARSEIGPPSLLRQYGKGPRIAHLMLSYAYAIELQREHVRDLKPHLMIDSGAFSVAESGRVIDLDEYCTWMDAAIPYANTFARSCRFMTLDVVRDQAATWVNTHKLLQRGYDVIPIVTANGTPKDVEQALEIAGTDGVIAFGALGNPEPVNRRILDGHYRVVMAHREKTGHMPRTHLLGVGRRVYLERYPAWSSDTSSWLKSCQYGGGDSVGLKRMPRKKDLRKDNHDAYYAAARLALVRDLEALERLTDEMTALWAARGIVWDDDNRGHVHGTVR